MSAPQNTEDQYVEMWMADGLVHCIFKVRKIDMDIAVAMVEARKRFFDGKSHATLVDISRVKSITKEARDLFASKEGTIYIKAAALYGNSVITNMLATFFMTFNKPAVPIKLFNNKEEAQQWLNQYAD